jgi:hypothetical protein
VLARQRAECDAVLARQRAEFEQRYAVLERELLAKIEGAWRCLGRGEVHQVRVAVVSAKGRA